jgi:hypothetical protein
MLRALCHVIRVLPSSNPMIQNALEALKPYLSELIHSEVKQIGSLAAECLTILHERLDKKDPISSLS